MKKTILGLSNEISIIALSCIMLFYSLVSEYQPINNSISFLFVFAKCIVFLAIPLILYVTEKDVIEFKKVAGIYTSYSIINLFITIISSFSMIGGVVSSFWKMIFDLVNLVILLSSLLVTIEQFLLFNGIKSKIYSYTIMKVVYTLGNFVSYPFLMFIDRQIDKDKRE